LPFCALFALAALVGNQLTTNSLERRDFTSLLAISLFLHYYVYRPDFEHQAPSMALMIFLLPTLFGVHGQSWPDERTARAAFGFVLLLGLPAAVLPPIQYRQAGIDAPAVAVDLLRSGFSGGSDAARIAAAPRPLSGSLGILYPRNDETRVVQFVRAQTTERDAVYVGLADHSLPYLNNMRVYWMLGRRVGSRHYMLMTGFTNNVAAQSEMIADLQARHVRWVVLWKGLPADRYFLSRNLPGATLLDEYLASHYHTVAVFGDFEIRSGN
jgi:hypothetical protein